MAPVANGSLFILIMKVGAESFDDTIPFRLFTFILPRRLQPSRRAFKPKQLITFPNPETSRNTNVAS